jgi:tripartite-type tricarboxylate transporter receptor subunit TctC
MDFLQRRSLLRSALALSLAAACGCAGAQAFPSKPLTLVVGFAPGGAGDLISRRVGQKMSQNLGQPVVVENRPGAGAVSAATGVAKSPPDGHTMLLTGNGMTLTSVLFKSLPYSLQRDFRPVSTLAYFDLSFITSGDSEFKSLAELFAWAKANPGKLSIGSARIGSTQHLAAELFKSMAGVDMVHVPYKGATPAMMDVISGHVSMGFMTSLGALEQIQAGKLRPLAVAYAKRLPELPDVPTMAEAGLDDFEVSSWNGLAAPAGTPQPILRKLNEEVNKILAMPDVREQLRTLGAQPVGGTPQAFADYVNAEIKKWREVIKAAGISLD